jgi:hypothetical protein
MGVSAGRLPVPMILLSQAYSGEAVSKFTEVRKSYSPEVDELAAVDCLHHHGWALAAATPFGHAYYGRKNQRRAQYYKY